MSEEILHVVESVSNEKGVSKDVIFTALESALAAVTERGYDTAVKVRVAIDRQTGSSQSYRCWDVVEEYTEPDEDMDLQGKEPDFELLLADAQAKKADAQVGDVIEEPIGAVDFGRIAAHQAKHIITRIVRDAERAKIAEAYKDRIGELITGQVKKVTRDAIIVELGNNVEGMIPKSEMIARESVRLGDRIRGYLYDLSEENRGPLVLLSRTHSQMLVELFKIEVPEISEGVIQIRAAARDPGSRAKIAVKTNDTRIDPIGACVGMRGSRVQAVSAELAGERVDIVLWDDNPAHLVINAMAPAEVLSIAVNEEAHSMDVAVSEEQLSQAIGRNGQNVRLASELTGWTLNVMTEEQAQQKGEEQSSGVREMFTAALDVDEDITDILIREGFASLEELAYVDVEELASVEEFDVDIAEALKERAKNALLTQAISFGENIDNEAEPAEDLLALPGMTKRLALTLASKGIVTQEDLADQAVDDLEEIDGLNPEKAAQLIMAARAPWFEDDDKAE